MQHGRTHPRVQGGRPGANDHAAPARRAGITAVIRVRGLQAAQQISGRKLGRRLGMVHQQSQHPLSRANGDPEHRQPEGIGHPPRWLIAIVQKLQVSPALDR